MQPSAGGLVSSLISYLEHVDPLSHNRAPQSLWIGASDLPEKKYREATSAGVGKGVYFEPHAVFLPEAVKSRFYQGFCNDCLWPLFHYFPSYAKFLPEHYEAYQAANAIFLKKILEVHRPGDRIWIHDYHLMLLPKMLRAVIPDANIGFFLHIPFPSFEVFRIMPNTWKNELVEGLLGADLIGFHTGDYMQYFLRSVKQLTGYELNGRKINLPDRQVAVDAFPVSVDFNKFYHASDSPEVFEEKNMIRKKMSGKQLLLSVDRLDYSKALVNRLESFDLFLEKNKSYRGKVTYVLLVVPSREIITKYKENKQEIERLISSINGKFGSLDWVPVLYQYKSVDFKRLAGLYFAADVALITPLRDGMNLVSKEFVSTRIDKRGVLILSDTAGASAELKEAIIVNPTDREEIASAILQALTMPVEEQVRRNESMQARIRAYDVVRWADDFLGQLALQHRNQNELRSKLMTEEVDNHLLQAYRRASKRLLLLDYDGTLAPLVKTPDLAVPNRDLLSFLQELQSDPRNTLVLVSGRKRSDLEKWFGTLDFGMVAEHGGYYKRPGENWQMLENISVPWKDPVRQLMTYYQSRCAGSLLEEKDLSIAWHYRGADKDLGSIRAQELISELLTLNAETKFTILHGHLVVEVRSPEINKGGGIRPWLRSAAFDFILCAGDDRTDEDMFAILPPHAFSIRIGLARTQANYNCRTQSNFLQLMLDFLQTNTEVVLER